MQNELLIAGILWLATCSLLIGLEFKLNLLRDSTNIRQTMRCKLFQYYAENVDNKTKQTYCFKTLNQKRVKVSKLILL